MGVYSYVIVKPNLHNRRKSISSLFNREHFYADFSAVQGSGLWGKTTTMHPDDSVAIFTVDGSPIDEKDIEKYLSAYPVKNMAASPRDSRRFQMAHPIEEETNDPLIRAVKSFTNIARIYESSKSIKLAKNWIIVELSVDGLPPVEFNDDTANMFRSAVATRNMRIIEKLEQDFSAKHVRADLKRRKKQAKKGIVSWTGIDSRTSYTPNRSIDPAQEEQERINEMKKRSEDIMSQWDKKFNKIKED